MDEDELSLGKQKIKIQRFSFILRKIVPKNNLESDGAENFPGYSSVGKSK